jgi:hypothetical protein
LIISKMYGMPERTTSAAPVIAKALFILTIVYFSI